METGILSTFELSANYIMKKDEMRKIKPSDREHKVALYRLNPIKLQLSEIKALHGNLKLLH